MLGSFQWVAISPGVLHTCGLVTSTAIQNLCGSSPSGGPCAGTPYCCGANDLQQLGTGGTVPANVPQATPVAVAPQARRRALTADGGGEDGDADRPRGLRTTAPFCFVSISAGMNYTCAVTTTGTGWCWGQESSGGTCTTTSAATSGGAQVAPTGIIVSSLAPSQQACFSYVDVGTEGTTCFISFNAPSGDSTCSDSPCGPKPPCATACSRARRSR